MPHKLLQIPIGSRARDPHKVPVFFRTHPTLESTRSGIQYLVHGLSLPLVQWGLPVFQPKACLGQRQIDNSLRSPTRLIKLPDEPREPSGDVQASPGGSRQLRVVVIAVLGQAARNAIEPLIQFGVLRQRQIDDGASDATIAILEWMQCFEPQMRGSRT